MNFVQAMRSSLPCSVNYELTRKILELGKLKYLSRGVFLYLPPLLSHDDRLITLEQRSKAVEVLQLDVSGRPQDWISAKEAASIYATDSVAWTLGDAFYVLRGGHQQSTGLQSRIEVHPIIAVKGSVPSRAWRHIPALTNPKLFSRDRCLCAYCGGTFASEDLTREHLVPTSRGGDDSWMNCITACRGCNGHKGNRLPEEAHMSLLYLPYVPSLHEDMILRGRRILADQMEFLMASVPKHSRLLA
jgi:5-methylcytosine-specific restriction endonuclease McrA